MEQSSSSVMRTASAKPQVAAGCLYLFALPFCTFGLFAAVRSIERLRAGDLTMAAYTAMFAIVFGGAGFGLVYAFRRGTRSAQARDRLRAANPDQPWLWREDWASGRIPASIGTRAMVLCGCAVLCFAASAPAVYAIPQELAKHNNLILLALIFPLAGIALLGQAARAAARWRVVRGAAFEMDSVPGQIGGTLGGKITLPAELRPTGAFTLGLRCVNRVTSNSGENSSTWEHVLWNDEQTASSDGAAVPVAFYIAPDTPASDYTNSNNEIIWRLSASAPAAAGKFDAQFEVPVFKVAETAEQQRLAEAVRERAPAGPELCASGGLADNHAPDAGRRHRGLFSATTQPPPRLRDGGIRRGVERRILADAPYACAAHLHDRMGFLRVDSVADGARSRKRDAGEYRRRRGYDTKSAVGAGIFAAANSG
jgi:hypothetical protein